MPASGGSRAWATLAIAFAIAVPISSTADAGIVATITDDPLKFNVFGVSTSVGTLTATLSTGKNRFANDNQITATVNLNAPFANCGSFHWLQVITSAAPGAFIPLAYGGKPLDSSKPNNPLPIIDVPNPNYDGRPPDDNLPWYLTKAEEGGSNPGLGGNTINADGSGTYTMIDQPTYGGFTFDTFFVGETGAFTFGVIAEFTWGYGSTGGASTLVPGPMDNFLPDAAAITEVNTALKNGGFTGYVASAGFNCVPEPASWAILATGLGVVAVSRRWSSGVRRARSAA